MYTPLYFSRRVNPYFSSAHFCSTQTPQFASWGDQEAICQRAHAGVLVAKCQKEQKASICVRADAVPEAGRRARCGKTRFA